MSFAQFTQSSCGVPISNWDIAKQVAYGSLVSAAVILSMVFMIYMLCGKCCAERQRELEKHLLELEETDSEEEDDLKEPLVKDHKEKKSE